MDCGDTTQERIYTAFFPFGGIGGGAVWVREREALRAMEVH